VTTATPTVLDFLERACGERFGPDLIRRVEQASLAELTDLLEHHREFRRSAPVPAKAGDGELRPYVPVAGDRTRDAAHGLALRIQDFKHRERALMALDSLKHHLLYCHSVAVDDATGYMLFSATAPQASDDRFRAKRAELVNYLTFLAGIEPLVRSGVVVLVMDVPDPLDRQRLVPDKAALAADADFSDLSGFFRDHFDEAQKQGGPRFELVRQAMLVRAEQLLARGLQTAAAHPGDLDLYLPFRHYEDLLRAAVRSGQTDAPAGLRQVELHVLDQLLSVPVPGLGRLTVADLVAIRGEEAAFARWREGLERALDRIERLDEDLLDPRAEALRVIRQELQTEQHALEEGIEKSGFLSGARAGLKTFAIGSVAGVTAIEEPGPGIAAGAMTGALTLIWDYVAGRRGRERTRALHRQYLVFSPSMPSEFASRQ
jgi:hypothetical protein